MKRIFNMEVRVEPDPEAERLLDEAMDLLAGALAEQFIARARAQSQTSVRERPQRFTLNFDEPNGEELN